MSNHHKDKNPILDTLKLLLKATWKLLLLCIYGLAKLTAAIANIIAKITGRANNWLL